MRGSRLDLAELCRDHAELRGPLERRVASFEEADGLLSARKRLRAPAAWPAPVSSSGGSGKAGWDASTWRWTPAAIGGSRSRPAPRACLPTTEIRRRFEREAAIIAFGCEHPNIVGYLSLDEYEECLFPDDESRSKARLWRHLPRARRWRRNGYRLSLTASRTRFAAAHARGVVHRDLKPSNLMWTADQGRLKVLDFGLAHLSAGADVESLTRTGCVLGTIPYLAPRAATRRNRRIHAPTHLLSSAPVLYELATGRRPFCGRHIGAILRGDLRASSGGVALGPSRPCPTELARLIDRCLARDASQRPRDGAELASELERASAEAPSRRLSQQTSGVGQTPEQGPIDRLTQPSGS